MSKKLIEALAESPSVKLVATVKRQERKIAKLTEALAECYAVISHIRHQTWPTFGLGIGLSPEALSEAIQLSDPLIPKSYDAVIEERIEELHAQAKRKADHENRRS